MFCGTSSVHAIELGLREQLRRLIEEVAGWLPQAWAPAVRWPRVLIDLPALTHLMQGYPVPAWMHQDPALKDFSVDDAAERRAALARGGMAALVSAWEAGEPLSLAWLQEWQRRWPETSADEAARLNELAALLRQHLEAFASVPRERSWEERRVLRNRLKLTFRRDFLQPAAAFAYLAIAALDLERLRAALVSRVLFATREGSP
jgi:hypothetical protein